MIASGFVDPRDVEQLPDGRLLVTDSLGTGCGSGHLTIVDPQTLLVEEFPTLGFSPNNIYVNDSGEVYLSAGDGAGTTSCHGVQMHNTGASTYGPGDFTFVGGVPNIVTGLTEIDGVLHAVNTSGGFYRYAGGGTFASVGINLGQPQDLVVNGNEILSSDYTVGAVRAYGSPGSTPVQIFTVPDLQNASSLAPDGTGYFYVTHQTTTGSVSVLDDDDNVASFVGPTSELNRPRGATFVPTSP